MKKFLVIMCCMIFAISTASAQEKQKKSKNQTTTFLVEGMHCENCVKSIEKNIAFEKGVTDLKCDLKTKTVKVTYNSDKTTEEKLITAFEKINKKAVVQKESKKKPEVKEDK